MKLTRILTRVVPFVLCAGAHAHAQASAQERAAASRLFDDAGKLFAAGNAAEACPKYAESQRLDPQLGTLLHLAECYAKLGKTASAWTSFRDAAEIAHKRADPREGKIRDRVSKLEATLSNLVITVAEPSADVEVREDGALVGRAIWGSPVPVDPGTHSIAASATGKQTWTSEVEVPATAGQLQVQVPPLEATPVAASAPTVAQPPKTPESPPGPAPNETRTSGLFGLSTQSLAGWSLVGAGAIGVGVGIVFTLKRSNEVDARDSICPTGVCPQAELDADRAAIARHTSDARTDGTIATIGYVAGGVLAAGGVVLLLTDRHSSNVGFTPLLGPGLAGLSVGGSL